MRGKSCAGDWQVLDRLCVFNGLRGAQCSQKCGGRGVVAKSLAKVGEEVDVAGAKNKGTAELEGIPSEFVLVVAGGFGALAALGIITAEEMEEIGFAEVGEFIGLAALVDEEGEVDAGFLLEEEGVAGVAEADGGEGRILGKEGWLMFAQLRDVLAAEDSAVVAEEDEDSGMRFPEGAEADLVAEGVGERDAGETLTEGFGHGGMIEEAGRRVKGVPREDGSEGFFLLARSEVLASRFNRRLISLVDVKSDGGAVSDGAIVALEGQGARAGACVVVDGCGDGG
jgi:hypothetical protein